MYNLSIYSTILDILHHITDFDNPLLEEVNFLGWKHYMIVLEQLAILWRFIIYIITIITISIITISIITIIIIIRQINLSLYLFYSYLE